MWVFVGLFKIHILHLFHPVFCVRCLLDLLRKHFLFQSLPFLLRLENVDREKELLNGTFFISSFDLCCKFLTVFFFWGGGEFICRSNEDLNKELCFRSFLVVDSISDNLYSMLSPSAYSSREAENIDMTDHT